jgi:uncharacterized protein YeaO (DUF488 family)
MTGTPEIRVRRVYDQPSPGDGQRFLVDRLWPRGLSKDAAGVSEWVKDVAPSDELRRWYGHDPLRFAEFRLRYAAGHRCVRPAAPGSRSCADTSSPGVGCRTTGGPGSY